MPTNVCTPYFKPGQDVTGHATETIGGKRCVTTTTGSRGSLPHVKLAPAGEPIFGVMSQDAVTGDDLHVLVGGIVPIITGATVTPGTQVEVDAAGAVIPHATGVPVGYVVAGATTGNAAAVKLYG